MARTESNELLQAALVGYQHELSRIDEKIAEIRRRLGAESPAASGGRRAMSESARERLAAAQRKRWDAFRKGKAAGAAKPAQKSRISAAGRRRIIEATKKRWAEYRAKKAAAAKGSGRKPSPSEQSA